MTTSRDASTETTNGAQDPRVRPPGQLWQVPLFLVGLVALALAGAASSLNPPPIENPLERELAIVRRALEKPGDLTQDLTAVAESAVAHASGEPERAGEAHYLLGVVYARRAERSPPDQARDQREKANMHFELAELRGVPATDRARLTYQRGKLAYVNGGDPQRAIDLLKRSLPGGTDNPAEGFALLVMAQLQKSVPDLDGALDANLKQLEVCDDEAMLNQARLLRGELLLKKGMRVEAVKALETIGSKAAVAIRLKARYIQATAGMEEGMWSKAIAWWDELLPYPAAVPGGAARIQYNLGICFSQYDAPAHLKEAAAAWVKARDLGGEEGQAASVRLGEMSLAVGPNPAAALDYFGQALEKVSIPSDYKNSLVEVSKVRDLLEAACSLFDKQQDSEHFLVASELYKKLAEPGMAEERIGQAAEARGRELLAKAKEAGFGGGTWKVQAQDKLQRAALAYEQAADTRPPSQRVDVLWHCFECYQLADRPEQAIGVLKKFVQLPTTRERQAEAWFELAQLQRLLKLADARESYKQCVMLNNEAFTSRALLQLADIAEKLHELADAEAVLQQIVNPPGLIADREAHQQGLFKLALLYFQQNKFDAAAIKCKELIKQYPAHPNVLSVRDQLGECYSKLAEQAKTNMDPDNVTPNMKAHYRQEWLRNLEDERDTYQQLADDLDAKAAKMPATNGPVVLAPVEETLRRKALFAVARCYYELPNYFEEAFKRYVQLFERFREEPDALWACYNLCLCRNKAFDVRHPDRFVVEEAAMADVEYCLKHIEEFERAHAFANPQARADFVEWMQRWHDEVIKSHKQGGR